MSAFVACTVLVMNVQMERSGIQLRSLLLSYIEVTCGVVTCEPLPPGLGFASSHLYAVVRPLDLKSLAFSVPADGATNALARAAWTLLAHRARLRKSSFYRRSKLKIEFRGSEERLIIM
jgi:hypothetical protein